MGGPSGRSFFEWSEGARSIVYVAGFDVYDGALERGPHRWLDLDRTSDLRRTYVDIQRIWYVTAVIQGPRRHNQLSYLQALGSMPRTAADKHKTRPLGVLPRAHFEMVVCTPKGSVVKPVAWTPEPASGHRP